MIQFLIYSAAMLLFSILILFYGSWRRRAASSPQLIVADEHEKINLDVLRDQLRELEHDFQNDILDNTEYQNTKRELDMRAARVLKANQSSVTQRLQPRWTVLLVGIGVTALATLIYAMIGIPAGINATQNQAIIPSSQELGTAAPSPQQIAGMVSRLAERLKSSPDDAQGWAMLARSYETLRRFDLAVDAYQHLVKLTPQDANMLDDYAVTLAMSRDQSLSGEPEQLIHRALAIDPNNIQALALLGSAAFERKEYAQAAIPWKKILDLIPADSPMSQSITDNIRKADGLAKDARQ